MTLLPALLATLLAAHDAGAQPTDEPSAKWLLEQAMSSRLPPGWEFKSRSACEGLHRLSKLGAVVTNEQVRSLCLVVAKTGPLFLGFTGEAHSGDLGGPRGANALCHATFAGSHLCTRAEYLAGGGPSTAPDGGVWVEHALSPSPGGPGNERLRGSRHSCENWTSGSPTAVGATFTASTEPLTTTNCAHLHPLPCCQYYHSQTPPPAPVQFTRATFTGNTRDTEKLGCSREFPGSWFCSWNEYMALGSPATTPAGGAWVGRPTQSIDELDGNLMGQDCANRTSASPKIRGLWLNGQGLISSGVGACAIARPLSCCLRSTQDIWSLPSDEEP